MRPASSDRTRTRTSPSVLPAIRAVFKATTSLAGQPTDRPPNDMGFVQSPWAMRRYRVERERPLSDFTEGRRRMVLGMLEPLGVLLNMRPVLRLLDATNSWFSYENLTLKYGLGWVGNWQRGAKVEKSKSDY